MGGPIREALHQTKAFKAAKDAAAHAEETIREVSADTGLSESERESNLREAVDLLSRPKLLETEAIAANSAAAKAKTEFDKAALELSTATRKIQHDVDEDSEVRTALAEHSRLRGEVNDAKRKLASLLAALRADEAHAANDANALQQMKQNDAVKRQQWKLLPWRRYRPR